MRRNMECLICGSNRIKSLKTKMSDFLVSRIFGEHHPLQEKETEVNLCHCEDCSFSFYDRRLSDEEGKKLYASYRGEEYQKIRERYDCWYTAKINNAMNNDRIALDEQRRVIDKIIQSNIKTPINNALDYGGNRGDTFSANFNSVQKFVYDISDVDTVNGVNKISSYDELFNYTFDFIMCNMTLEHISQPLQFTNSLYDIGKKGTYYYFEVPSENPFEKNKFSFIKNAKLLFDPNYNKIKLIRHYLHIRKEPYMPMSEHVNFYTPKAMRILLEKTGFEVIDIQENHEKSVLGESLVLSALCRK